MAQSKSMMAPLSSRTTKLKWLRTTSSVGMKRGFELKWEYDAPYNRASKPGLFTAINSPVRMLPMGRFFMKSAYTRTFWV